MKPFHAFIAAAALSAVGGCTTAQTSSPEIKYQRNVDLEVGQSTVVYGYRGDCGRLPNESAVRLPSAKTGEFTLGREGWRTSGRCNGPTPAVEVVFKATTPGRETISIQGDPVHIEVSP